MSWAKVDRPEFAVLDLRMPGPSGLELASDLLKLYPEVNILLLTGSTSPKHPAAEIAYLKKPADCDAILEALGLS
jgi:two-component system response regulator RegA